MMRVELLQQVRQHIVRHPDKFSAAHWAWARNVRDVLRDGAAPAGFKCCIAGRVLLLGGAFDERTLLQYSVSCDDGYLGRCARALLRLTEAQYKALFYPSQWAEPYRSRYYLAPDAVTEAGVAAAYVAYFAGLTAEPPPRGPAPDRPALPFQAAPATPAPNRPVRS